MTASPDLATLLAPRDTATVKTALLGRLSDKKFPINDWEDGGVARTLIEADAEELSALEASAVPIAQSGFLGTATDDAWLEKTAHDLFEVDRYPATFTVGPMVLTCAAGAGPYTINAGQLWFADPITGLRYTNAASGVLTSSATLSLASRAESPGAAYNLLPNHITTMVTPLPGVTCNNPEGSSNTWATTQGTDQESKELLIQRCQDKWATLGYGQNDAWYRYYARESSVTVTRVAIVTNPGGVSNKVKVAIAGPSGPLDSGTVEATAKYLAERKGNTTILEVAAADTTDVTFTGDAYVQAELADAWPGLMELALEALLRTINVHGTLYLAAIIEKLMEIPGTVNVVITLPATDITAGALGIIVRAASPVHPAITVHSV